MRAQKEHLCLHLPEQAFAFDFFLQKIERRVWCLSQTAAWHVLLLLSLQDLDLRS